MLEIANVTKIYKGGSVGIEDVQDIIKDLRQALEKKTFADTLRERYMKNSGGTMLWKKQEAWSSSVEVGRRWRHLTSI